MEIPVYLALPAAEFYACAALPVKPAWMACHFSSGSTGLSNIPDTLPAGSLLIVDDSMPFQEHDPALILSQLQSAVATLAPDALLLDFQRPEVDEVQSLANAITEQLPCPVAVSACYAKNLPCAIFLPPGPLYKPLEEYLRPYQGREIWLDAAPICGQMIVTTDKAQYQPQKNDSFIELRHYDETLHCHYGLQVEAHQIMFAFSRKRSDLVHWLNEAESLGVTCAVGLHQELGNLF